uniref:hypothetical protein n=1 Tax=Microbacterium proteolyticum TaxID=1572644 RepID=UPI0024170887|nr:hypothetical protein [Microbacterium proteolyticum]
MSSTAAKAAATAIAVVALLAGCASPGPNPTSPGVPAEQACAEPHATLSRTTIEPGGSVTIEGSDWSACVDTPDDSAPSAWTSVDLSFSQEGTPQPLGSAPLYNGTFTATVTVPDDAQPGEARVDLTSNGFSTSITVEISNG